MRSAKSQRPKACSCWMTPPRASAPPTMAAGSAPLVSRPRRASSPQNRSAVLAMAARSLPTMMRLPKGTDRGGFAADLKAQGIPTAIYYTKSMHQQTAYKDFPVADGGLPASESLSSDVVSLPVHAYLDEPTQERIIRAVRGALSA